MRPLIWLFLIIQDGEESKEQTEAYLAGINIGIKVAAMRKIKINKKLFFHNENLFDTMHKAIDVKSWRPDVIMGFNTSNQFFMSKAFFGDQLNLSISATDQSLATLPHKFYSLGIPDSDVASIGI